MEKDGWVRITDTEYIMLPLITKPDVESSNAFVIFTGKEFVIIDSAADGNRLNSIKSAVQDLDNKNELPKLLITTHIHMDHCYSALNGELFKEVPSLIWATHSAGAVAIEAGDTKPTIGDLFKRTYEARLIDIHLFSQTNQVKKPGNSYYSLSNNNGKIILSPTENEADHLSKQILSLPSGCEITLYHTPGHSPDSIIIQAGKDLFTGDILFSTAPGVAGLHGFQKEDLTRSIISIIHLIESDLEGMCYNGHGFAISKSDFLKGMKHILKEVKVMGEVSAFDCERLGKSKDHALDVISEADRLFAIIGGRLLAIEFDLEKLDLTKEALELSQIIEDEKIDIVLAEFHTFAVAFSRGENSDIRLVLKVVQILQKLEKIFSADSCSSYLDQSLITRSKRLLSDFIGTIRGFEDPTIESCSSLNAFIDSFIHSLNETKVSDESLLLASDNQMFLNLPPFFESRLK